jgi:hypothetical protein
MTGAAPQQGIARQRKEPDAARVLQQNPRSNKGGFQTARAIPRRTRAAWRMNWRLHDTGIWCAGGNRAAVDRLDDVTQPDATPAQPDDASEGVEYSQFLVGRPGIEPGTP